jgi:hypothetical protein
VIGYVSRKKKATIPWGAVSKDPSSWIMPECTPDGFKWTDPSKIRIGEVYRLLVHWRLRESQGLEPLVWETSCPLLEGTHSITHRSTEFISHVTTQMWSHAAHPPPMGTSAPPMTRVTRVTTIATLTMVLTMVVWRTASRLTVISDLRHHANHLQMKVVQVRPSYLLRCTHIDLLIFCRII